MGHTTKTNRTFTIIALVFLMLITSCASRRDVVYFQDADLAATANSINNYGLVIKPDDVLTIVVSALDQDLSRPFNLTSMTYSDDANRDGRTVHQGYLVDANGNIEFPVLGTIKLGGLNRAQATELIKSMLKEYLKNPIVIIRMQNFKVTVLGEVQRPGVYTIENDRLTILEALGLAGDLNLQAERKNVLVIREDKGKTTYNRVDLTTETLFNSPMYYLTQNDVIYVEPNNSRIKSSSIGPNVGATLNTISTLAAVAALIVSLTR